MRRLALGAMGVWLVAGVALVAADPWEGTPFLEWSDDDVEKVMTDSPWAHSIRINLPPQLPVPQEAGGRGGRGGGGGDDFAPAAGRIPVVVSWRTALPLRQALVRSQVGQGGTLEDAHQQLLAATDRYYVLAIVGLPPPYLRPIQGEVEAYLRRDDKEDIPAAEMAPQGGTLLVGFPRGDISEADEEVELVMRLDRLSFKRKFKLEEMVYEGRLEL